VRTGVLVMAYGTPTGPDEVASFYTDVRRGRAPSEEQLADLERRYNAIGGVSPLGERTAAQVAAIGAALEKLAPGRFRTVYGAKHSKPKIEDAVDELARDGVGHLVGLVLAPHYSVLSVGEYVARARDRAERHGMTCAFVERWHDDPVLVQVLAERVHAAVASLGQAAPGRLEVLFTAHSLPERILTMGDRYPEELAETARLVAGRLGISAYRVGWQSAGRTPEPWIGPDVLALLPVLRAEGVEAVVVCPAGFISDHLEVLYDLDIEARRVAEGLGLAFARTDSLNDEPRVAAALARRVLAADTATSPTGRAGRQRGAE